MEAVLFTLGELILTAIEATVLGAVLWQLFHLRRDIMAMIRVLRRIDRKISEPTVRS